MAFGIESIMSAKDSEKRNERPQFNTPGHYGSLEVIDIDLKDNSAILAGSPAKVPLWNINLNSIEDTEKFWKLFVKKLIEKLQAEGSVPKEYKTFVLREDEDSTGDPALYVKILIQPGQQPSDIKVVEWNQFTNSIRDRLIEMFKMWKFQGWPYVQLGQAAQEEHASSR